MFFRKLSPFALMALLVAAGYAESHGLLSRCRCEQSTGAANLRTPGAQNQSEPVPPPPKAGGPVSPIGLNTAPNLNAEIVKRINVWTKDSSGDPKGGFNRIAIKVDGKDYILEYRIIPGIPDDKGGDPNSVGALRAALERDAPTPEVRQKGLTFLSKVHDSLSSAILVTPDDFPTIASVFSKYEASLKNQSAASSLKNTRQEIRTQLELRLKGIDLNSNLNPTTRQTVSDALKDVARALASIP